MSKFVLVLSIIFSTYLTIIGFAGKLHPVIGGIGWLIVGINSITFYIKEKHMKNISDAIMAAAERGAQEQKIRSLYPQDEEEQK